MIPAREETMVAAMRHLVSWFFAPRTVWWPTWLGWLALFMSVAVPLAAWARWGEEFLRRSVEVEPDVLVVEAWIGPAAVEQAAKFFHEQGFKWVVATAVNEPAGVGFADHDFAASASRILREKGVPADRVIRLSLPRVPKDRSLTAHRAVGPALAARGVQPRALTVFTVGPHACRSRLVLQSLHTDIPVGCRSWLRIDADKRFWWESTERGRDFWVETVRCILEWFRTLFR